MATLVLVAAAAAALATARADLPVGAARCGETTCPPYTYCSPHDSHCRRCSDLCDPVHRNYERDTCEKYCQAYIHDQRYVLRNADIIEQLTRKVQSLTIVASVALVLGVLLLLPLAVYAVRLARAHKHLLWRFTKRGAARSCTNGKQKVGASAEDPEAVHKGSATGTESEGGAPMPTPSPAALSRSVSRDVATPATTSTPLSRPRHPSEDTTLEYAYDNPALAPSPSPGADAAPATLTGISPVTPGLGGRKESSF